ncbi:MAG: 30S ribosomal protein S19e [Candidatus Micrarchaeota archaeon]
MVTVYDVDAMALVKASAQKLEELGLPAPSWVGTVKSGPHRQRLPQDPKFWYMRCASLLRQAYVSSPIGVSSLRTHYGARKMRGVRPEKHRKAGGNMIRKGLQALEKAGLITKKKVGRCISPTGQALLDSVAKDIAVQKPKQ